MIREASRPQTRVIPQRRTRAHEINDWVRIYSSWRCLTKPEEAVLEQLRDRLPSMKMLDIGVGGGRTTLHFAELAKEYIGIDFDANMVRACERRFPNRPAHVSLMWGDARSMSMFHDGTFDFILFSFQGIDYLSHAERLQALREIRRVGKEKGYFFFSTHNLNQIDKIFTIHDAGTRRGRLKALFNHLVIRMRNEPKERLRTRPYAIIYDGIYSAKLKWLWLSLFRRLGHNYYIKPDEQIRQLEENGFKVLRVYTIDGREIVDNAALGLAKDPWIHYLCEFASPN